MASPCFFLLPRHLFASYADWWHPLFIALHTCSLPSSPGGKLLCSEARSWHWRETALWNSSDVGDGQLEAAMATAGFSSLWRLYWNDRESKTQRENPIQLGGTEKPNSPTRSRGLFIYFAGHPCCFFYNNLVDCYLNMVIKERGWFASIWWVKPCSVLLILWSSSSVTEQWLMLRFRDDCCSCSMKIWAPGYECVQGYLQ